jgi:hypothetical protein
MYKELKKLNREKSINVQMNWTYSSHKKYKWPIIHEKVFDIFSPQENPVQNYFEIPPHANQNGYH